MYLLFLFILKQYADCCYYNRVFPSSLRPVSGYKCTEFPRNDVLHLTTFDRTDSIEVALQRLGLLNPSSNIYNMKNSPAVEILCSRNITHAYHYMKEPNLYSAHSCSMRNQPTANRSRYPGC